MVFHQIECFHLELTLPVHEATIIDPVFSAPLFFGNLRITVDAFIDGLAPVFDADRSHFLVHILPPSIDSALIRTIIEGFDNKYQTHAVIRLQGFCGFIILTGNPTPAATRR